MKKPVDEVRFMVPATATRSFSQFFANHTLLFLPTAPTDVAALVSQSVFSHLLIVTLMEQNHVFLIKICYEMHVAQPYNFLSL